jgi:hypothetical protein
MNHIRVAVSIGDAEVGDGVATSIGRRLERLEVDVMTPIEAADGDVAVRLNDPSTDTRVDVLLEEAEAQAIADGIGEELTDADRRVEP